MKRLMLVAAMLSLFAVSEGSLRPAEAQGMLGPGFFFGPRMRSVPIGPQPQYRAVRRSKQKVSRRYSTRRSQYVSRRNYTGRSNGYSPPAYQSNPNPHGLYGQQPSYAPCTRYTLNVDGSKHCF